MLDPKQFTKVRCCLCNVLLCAAIFWASLRETDAVRKIPLTQVAAVVGDPVFLPCDISTAGPNDHVLLVLWYREDLGTPIYSVDGRDRDFSNAERWSDENVFANRAYFMPEKRPAELGVDHVRETDRGLYRCRVDFRMAQTRNSKVNLTVIVPPKRIIIMNESGSLLTSVVGPFIEGDSFSLRCDVFGGSPPPTVSWYKNQRMVSNTSVILPSVSSSHVRAELRVTRLTRADVHSEITCKARNHPRTPPLTATLHLDMNFGPLDVRILGANQPLSASRHYDLLCQSSGSRPPASLTWWKDGQRLDRTKETTSNDGNTTTSTLSLVVSKEDMGKHLTCRANNNVISSSSIEDSWKLDVQYIPDAQIFLGSSIDSNNIREGTDVYFDCIIKAHPGIFKVEWRHNGRTLSHNVGNGVIVSNQSLVLQGVSRLTAGNYTCVGYNAEGDGESNPFQLDILYAPTCRPNQTRIHGVAKQERAQIQCQVDANPTDVHFHWTFNNSAESVDVAAEHVARVGADTASLVTYTPVTELDYGTLLCYASNRVGAQRVPCLFHIIAADRPSQVRNCSVHDVTMSSFGVQCMQGYNGGLPQTFLLQVREVNSHHLLANLSSQVARWSVSSLESGIYYQVSVSSFNGKGISNAVTLQVATFRQAQKHHTDEIDKPEPFFKFTPMLSLIIGVVCSLLLVILVVIIVMRFQCTPSSEDHKFPNAQSTSETGIDKSDSFSKDSRVDFDTDDKNPDIIPQPVELEESLDLGYRIQRVSTIEATPSLGFVYQGDGIPTYVGYCTLRNGVLTRDVTIYPEMVDMPPRT